MSKFPLGITKKTFKGIFSPSLFPIINHIITKFLSLRRNKKQNLKKKKKKKNKTKKPQSEA
jgi:hypothetical protein